jgi:hypothetical protein
MYLKPMSADDEQPKTPPTISPEEEMERSRIANEIAQILRDAGFILDPPKRH